MRVTKTQMREINKGNMLASFNLELEGIITLREVLLLKGSEGSLFLGMPSKHYTNKDGGKAYSRLIDLEKTLKYSITMRSAEAVF